MKRFKHYLQEAMDTPYSFEKISGSPNKSMVYTFTTQDDDEGKVYMQHSLNPDIGTEVIFTINDKIKSTNYGDPFRIFATVSAAIDDYLKKSSNVSRIVFSGTKLGDPQNKRVKLYGRLAKKLAKKYRMKLDVRDHDTDTDFYLIKEEWITQNDWVGDMWKNPAPRELSEYMKTVNQFNIAGIVADGDIYLFDGMHDDGFEEIRKHKNAYPRKAFRWRAIIKGGKFVSLGPSGGDPIDYYGVSKETREELFKDMATVYTNKYMKSRMGTYDQAFGEVIRAFMRFSGMEEQEVFAELEQLKKKYKVK